MIGKGPYRAGGAVRCDHCGALGHRHAGNAAPDFWFYLESTNNTPGKRSGEIYVVYACTEQCRDGIWKRTGRGVIDDECSQRMRAKLLIADGVGSAPPIVANAEAVGAAAQRREREATIAYLLDRAEQYKPSSGYQAFIDELTQGLASGDHTERCAAGEYEDLYVRVQRIMRREP